MKYALLTDVGKYRTKNEDAIKVLQNDQITLALLCDGMGGHSKGEIASNLTIKAYEWMFYNEDLPFDTSDSVTKWFSKGVKKTLNLMKLEAKNDQQKLDMGTTLVGFLKFKKSPYSYFFNIGDSRSYVYNGFLTQITNDQNQLNYLIKYENYSEIEAKKTYGSQALLSSLGPNKVCKPEAHYLSQPFKYVLMTSDGIHDYLTKPFMERILFESTTLEEKVQKFISSALESDSHDNLSVIIIEVF